MRVALDTNVIVAALATRGLCADVMRVTLAEHDLILGSTVLDELKRVLVEKLGLTRPAAQEAIDFLIKQASVVEAGAPSIRLSLRDPSDLAVVAEAIAGGADVLVTGDADLHAAVDKAPIPIVSPRTFWELLRGAGEEGA